MCDKSVNPNNHHSLKGEEELVSTQESKVNIAPSKIDQIQFAGAGCFLDQARLLAADPGDSSMKPSLGSSAIGVLMKVMLVGMSSGDVAGNMSQNAIG